MTCENQRYTAKEIHEKEKFRFQSLRYCILYTNHFFKVMHSLKITRLLFITKKCIGLLENKNEMFVDIDNVFRTKYATCEKFVNLQLLYF